MEKKRNGTGIFDVFGMQLQRPIARVFPKRKVPPLDGGWIFWLLAVERFVLFAPELAEINLYIPKYEIELGLCRKRETRPGFSMFLSRGSGRRTATRQPPN